MSVILFIRNLNTNRGHTSLNRRGIIVKSAFFMDKVYLILENRRILVACNTIIDIRDYLTFETLHTSSYYMKMYIERHS